MAAPIGSANPILISLFFDFKKDPTPDNVPPVPIAQIKASIFKAHVLMDTLKAKGIRCMAPNDYLHYGIEKWTPLRYSHLLALILYSDRTELQFRFTSTFRQTELYQSLSDIKQNNREYYHWSRNIREAVEYYGSSGWSDYWDDKRNISWNNKKGPFYCGMSSKMVIPEVMIRLNGPTSSTRQIQVATKFGGDHGVFMRLDNKSYSGADCLN